MKILFLYNNQCAVELSDWIKKRGHDVVLCNEVIDYSWCQNKSFDLVVSYTYRYILSKEVIEAFDGNVVNLHNSFLPFNRGADPNIWSVVDKTPRGVTLHYMDAGLDKGYIIAQKFVIDGENETFKSSYDNLDAAAKELFKEAFYYVDFWPELKKQAIGIGNYHSVKDGLKIKEQIESYDETIASFRERYRRLN